MCCVCGFHQLSLLAMSLVNPYSWLVAGLQNIVLVPPSAVSFFGCNCQASYVSQWSHSTGEGSGDAMVQ